MGPSRYYQGINFPNGGTFRSVGVYRSIFSANFFLCFLRVYWPLLIWQISEDEITFLTGGDDPYNDDVVLNKLFHPNLQLLLVSEGSQGCRYYTKVNFKSLHASTDLK